MKVVINTNYGGFRLSDEAEGMLEQRGVTVDDILYERSHQALVEVVELLGPGANAQGCNLKVVEIPDDVKWHVAEYDGSEWVAENHRTWT